MNCRQAFRVVDTGSQQTAVDRQFAITPDVPGAVMNGCEVGSYLAGDHCPELN